MSKTVLLPSDLQNGYLANLSRPRRSPCILSVDKSHEWTVKRSIRCAHASGDARGPRSAPYHQETCIRAQRWLVNSAMTQTPVKPADSPSTQIGTLSAKPATRLTVGHGPPDDASTIRRVRISSASGSDAARFNSDSDDHETTQTRMQQADVESNAQRYFPTISGKGIWNGSSYHRVRARENFMKMTAFWSDFRHENQPGFRETGDSPATTGQIRT